MATKKASKAQAEKNKQKQAYMRAAGYNVPLDGSWGPYQQSIWTKLTTRPKRYNTTLTGLAEGIWDKVTGNNTERFNPLDQGVVRIWDSNNVDWSKTRKSQSKVVNAVSGTWGPIVAMATAPAAVGAAVSAPLATAATLAGGSAGGYAVNKASEALTGQDFGTNVAMHTPLTPGMGEMFNPGYLAGGYGAERRMLDAIYNQVTPVSYGDNMFSLLGAKSKAQELGLVAKDFFTPKRIRTSVDDIPAWRQRIDYNSYDASQMPPEYLTMLKGQAAFRDDAWRLATRQKPRTIDINGDPHTLYIKNQDGTYSYDFDYIDRVRGDIGMIPLKEEKIPFLNSGPYHEGLNKGVAPDVFTTNGGNIGVDLDLVKEYNGNYNLNMGKPYRIHDKWDLQPLKDEAASLAPAFSRWLTMHPNKVTNYIRNKDALEAVGGNSFMLDMQVDPNIVGVFGR